MTRLPTYKLRPSRYPTLMKEIDITSLPNGDGGVVSDRVKDVSCHRRGFRELLACCGGLQGRLVIDGHGSMVMDLQGCSEWRQLLSSGS
jgi:hypothetical protein